MKGALLRRLIHASTALILLLNVTNPELFRPAVWSLAGLALALEVVRLSAGSFNAWLTATVPVFRPGERTRISGATALWLGYAAAIFFPPVAATAGVLGAALADPAASLVGGRLGPGDSKSFAGSTAFFLVIVAISVVLGFGTATVVLLAVGSTLLERFSGPVDDNFLIAPAIAAGVWILS